MLSKIRAWSAILYVLLVIPFTILFMYILKDKQRDIRRLTARVFLKLFSTKAEVLGSIDESAQILILNHQSFMDVIFLEALHSKNLCWIAKKELGKPFLYGHALKAPKMILINRESKKELVHLLKEAKDRLESGRVLCIFPEGTRSRGEEKLLPFKSGAKFLVEHFKLKVQPVVVCGSRDCLDIGNISFNNTPFKVKFLDSFVPDGEEWFKDLEQKMQQEYTKLYLEYKGLRA
ncbi:MAG: lysophospholipid acyltransferase family protein [Helicobacter sp.]|nr:lysophospholipid acyltransferase family protein [Helicobacteraceae bacterium]MDY3113997.1 lysophospholipid acyltransferase family protein [Helicobacter sp.]